jgi:hypothetical protein
VATVSFAGVAAAAAAGSVAASASFTPASQPGSTPSACPATSSTVAGSANNITGITGELPDCPEIAEQDIPKHVKSVVEDMMDAFPTRNDGKKGGWCTTYKKGPNKGQPLPPLTSFIFSPADPTTHKWGE